MTTIVRIETFLVEPGWVFTRIEDSDGCFGWGEAGTQLWAPSVRAAIDHLAPRLLGIDAHRIEEVWQLAQRLNFFVGGPIIGAAVSAIDIALWDLLGRMLGQPIHGLLGGQVRDRIAAYAWVGQSEDPEPSELAEHARSKIDAGYFGVKMTAANYEPCHTHAVVLRVRRQAKALRDAVGEAGRFAIDLHGRYDSSDSIRLLDAIRDLDPWFVEEPVRPEQVDQLARVVRSTTVPIATGERAYSRAEFRHLAETGIAIAQPDVAMAAGISETRRIASFVETYGISVIPHCAIGPLALAATLQIATVSPNAIAVEQDADHFLAHFARYVDASIFEPREGYVEIPNAVGLGVEVDEVAVRDSDRIGRTSQTQIIRHPDGSLADW